MRRREFLSKTAASVALPAVLDFNGEEPNALSAISSSSGPELARATPAGVRWDYLEQPVNVSETPPGPAAPEIYHPFRGATYAFDGYGAQGSKPAAMRGWHPAALPTSQTPAILDIDYGTPIAVSAFVHYFYTPENADMQFMSPAPSAFRRVRVLARNNDDGDWKEIQILKDLAAECPQVLAINAGSPARHWRLEITELAPGAEMIMSYEIETYTGGAPRITPVPVTTPDFRHNFTRRVATHRSSLGTMEGWLELAGDGKGFGVTAKEGKFTARGELRLLVDHKPVSFLAAANQTWQAETAEGIFTLQSQSTALGLLVQLRYAAKPDQPVKYRRATLRMSVPKASLYYIPGQTFRTEPVEVTSPTVNVLTRIAVLGSQGMNLCLVPGVDRGNLGFTGGAAFNDLLLGPNPTPVLIAATQGDWWKAYQFAVRDVYGIQEQEQLVPVSEMQYGISRYLVSEPAWSPAMNTVPGWPQGDATNIHYQGTDFFNLYGPVFSIPALWSRYVMNGDELARERCRKVALWLSRSGVRMQQGPARGAFFCLQRFRNWEPEKFDQLGATQGPGLHKLTSQSTGAALWALLYYRKVTGEHDPEINKVIEEAADWLLKTQRPDGGWPFCHDLEGNPQDWAWDLQGGPRSPALANSSGTIWNIWALWRLGKQTGDQRCGEAVERAKKWFAQEYVSKHYYYGYWEDDCWLMEGYDAAVATLAFAEMGEKDLAAETARDAIQFVCTHQLETRDARNSVGMAAEQRLWPPMFYCVTMISLAAWTAWQFSHDEFFRPFAMNPKVIGWWYRRDIGAPVWIADSIVPAPLVGPGSDSIWVDWCAAQAGTLTLRWVMREFQRRASGAAQLDEETLRGTVLGRPVKLWAPEGGFWPVMPEHGQVNWLGFRGERSLLVALMNDGAPGRVGLRLNSRNTNGVLGAAVWAKTVHHFHNGSVASIKWDGEELVEVGTDGVVVLEWELAA
jgi:hypothetical protein